MENCAAHTIQFSSKNFQMLPPEEPACFCRKDIWVQRNVAKLDIELHTCNELVCLLSWFNDLHLQFLLITASKISLLLRVAIWKCCRFNIYRCRWHQWCCNLFNWSIVRDESSMDLFELISAELAQSAGFCCYHWSIRNKRGDVCSISFQAVLEWICFRMHSTSLN